MTREDINKFLEAFNSTSKYVVEGKLIESSIRMGCASYYGGGIFMFKPSKKRISIPIPPNVDTIEVNMEGNGKIILNPVNQQKKKKKSLASVKGILSGEFYKKYGKLPVQVIRESRNEVLLQLGQHLE